MHKYTLKEEREELIKLRSIHMSTGEINGKLFEF